MKGLEAKGYTVNIQIEKVSNGNGEYYVYADVNGAMKLVFSWKEEDRSKGAIIGNKITNDNVNEVIKLITG